MTRIYQKYPESNYVTLEMLTLSEPLESKFLEHCYHPKNKRKEVRDDNPYAENVRRLLELRVLNELSYQDEVFFFFSNLSVNSECETALEKNKK